MAAALSIDRAIRWAQGFARAEWRLVAPVALAFLGLPALVFQLALPDDMGTVAELLASDDPRVSLLTALSAPLLICTLFGLTAIATLATAPAISVREALGRAARRFPAILLSGLALAFAIIGLFLILAFVLAGIAIAGGGAALVQPLSLAAVVAVAAVTMARLTPFVPLMADRPLGPVDGLQASWRMTRARFWRLLAFALLFLVLAQVIGFAINAAIGTVLLMAGRLLGAARMAMAIIAVVSALIGAVINTGYILIATGIYRQLSARD